MLVINRMAAARHGDNASGAPIESRVNRLRDAAFAKLRKPFSELLRDIITTYRDDGAGLDDERKKAATGAVDRLCAMGYEPNSALDAASALLRERFTDIVT